MNVLSARRRTMRVRFPANFRRLPRNAGLWCFESAPMLYNEGSLSLWQLPLCIVGSRGTFCLKTCTQVEAGIVPEEIIKNVIFLAAIVQQRNTANVLCRYNQMARAWPRKGAGSCHISVMKDTINRSSQAISA